MLRLISATAALLAVLFLAIAPAAAQSRVALVIGNSAYAGAARLKTTAADADLVATSLKAAGFDVTQATDLTAAAMGDSFTTFVEKVKAAGKNGVVFVYFAGYGAQFNGDSYLVPVDATIAKAEEVPNVSLSLTDITNALGAVPSAARIIVLDAARDGGFGNSGGSQVTPGLALVGVPAGFLLAYPAAPGTDICTCAENEANSPYASSLATLLRQPGLDIGQVFDGVRLQINQASGGAQIPWMVSALSVEVKLFEAKEAPKTLLPACGVANIPVPPAVPRKLTRARFRELSAEEAYRIAVERDSLEVYQWFVEGFPRYRLTGQFWRIIERRRDAILWHRALVVGTTAAYWNYLDTYSDGVYAREARYWLTVHRVPPPPRNYTPVLLDLPPGYVDEATGLPYIVAKGRAAPRPVFGHVETVYVEPVAQWTPPRVVIVVRPPPPPPPPDLIDRKIIVIQRPIVQPVQPINYVGGCAGTRGGCAPGQKEREQLQRWQESLKRQQEELAKQYHAPVVQPTSAILSTALSSDKPVGPGGGPQPKKGVTIGNAKPNEPVKPPVSNAKPNEPVKPTIGNVKPNEPVKPTIGNVKPNQPVKPTIGNAKPNEPVKPTIGNAKPNEPVKPPVGNAKPNEPVKPTIGNAKPNEPVKPTIGNTKPNQPVKPTIGNAKPNEPVKPAIGNAKPNQPAKPTIGNAKPNEPVKPTIGNAKPNEPVKPTIGNTKPNQPAKPTIGNAKPNQPVKPPVANAKPNEPVKPAISNPKPNQPVKPPVANAKPEPIKPAARAPAKPAQPTPARKEEHTLAKPVPPAPPRREEHAVTKPAQPAPAAHPAAKPAPQPPKVTETQHPQPAPHPAGCPQGEHMANGHCVR